MTEYTKHDWETGETITAALMNHLETQYDCVLSLSEGFTGAYIKRNADDEFIVLSGGSDPTIDPVINLSGKNRSANTGNIRFFTPNSAKSASNQVMTITGVTDTPALDMNSHKIVSLAAPTASADAATKNYVDTRLPTGIITLWHGTIANIPTGWVICDGNNGTPNLLSKFVCGVATAATNPGATGGEASHTLTEAEMPSHHHTYSLYNQVSTGNRSTDGNVGPNTVNTSDTGGGSAHENRPPFYAVAYLMKT